MKKKSITVILSLLLSSFSWGQTQVSFKGIPLGIPVNSFENQLLQKGFAKTRVGFHEFFGPYFPGEEYDFIAHVGIQLTPFSGLVEGVSVRLPYSQVLRDYWTSEDGHFKKFVDLFIQKYGNAPIYFTSKQQILKRLSGGKISRESVPYSRINSIDATLDGVYTIEWTKGNSIISITYFVEPQYSTSHYKKKFLGIIPYGHETLTFHYETRYHLEISYKDHSLGHADTSSNVGDI